MVMVSSWKLTAVIASVLAAPSAVPANADVIIGVLIPSS
jgi:hypothetical protein